VSDCDGCSIDCAAFAVGASCPMPSHRKHKPSCDACQAFRALPRLINTYRNGICCALARRSESEASQQASSPVVLDLKGAVKEVESMSKALAYVEEVTFLFMQHTTRGE